MKSSTLKNSACAGIVFLAISSVFAQLPKRDLSVELRQIEEAESAGYSAGTQSPQALLVSQQVNVRNGEKATLALGKSIPMLWVQSMTAQNASLAASGASASQSGGSITNALTWMDAGQSIKVLPRWTSAKQPVVVEIDVQTASVGDRHGAELPDQTRSQTTTTVSVTPGQWVTIAASGNAPQRGVVSSDGGSEARRLLQIRVLAP
jgi:hypothetical protein